MDSKCVSDTAQRLERLQSNFYIDSAMTGKIDKLKQELKFFRTYLMYMEISERKHQAIFYENETAPAATVQSGNFAYDLAVPQFKPKHSGSSSLSRMEVEFFKANVDLHNSMNQISLRRSRVLCADLPVSSMLKLMKDFEPQIREAYLVLLRKETWEYESALACRFWSDFTGSVIENLRNLLHAKHLVGSTKKLLESLQEKLTFLLDFVAYRQWFSPWSSRISYRGMKALSEYTQVAAALGYLGWVDEADETMAFAMENELSNLLPRIRPSTPELMELYFALLKASGSFPVERFVDFIIDDSDGLMKEDQIAAIRDGLACLIKFVMELEDDCTEDEKQISENIQAIARKVVSFGLQFLGNEVTKSQAEEENFVFSMLHKNVKLIIAEISLIELIRRGYPEHIYMEGEIAALHEGLNFLRTFFLAEEETSKHQKMFFSEFVKLAHEVTSLISSIHANRRTGKIAIILCLEKLKFIKSEVHLMEIQNRNANFPMKDEIDMLWQSLAFLRTYLTDSKDIENQTEEGHLFLAYVQATTTESSSLISSFCLNEFREENVNGFHCQLLKLVEKIKLIKAEVVLTELLNHETNSIVHMKDQIQKLQEDLRFFRSFLMDPPREYEEDGKMILRKVEAIVNEEATLICSFWKEDKTVQINFSLSELPKKVLDLKREIRQMYLHISQSFKPKHPRTDGLGFINSLLFKLKELQNHKADSIAFGKHQIEMLVEKLDDLKSFLIKIVEHHEEQEEFKHLWICVTDIAHEAENVIDSFVVRAGPLWYRMLWLTALVEEINAIKGKVMETKFEKRLPYTTRNAKHMPSKTSGAMKDEVVVGYSDEAEKIIGRLIRGSERMDFVPIIGMPGIGKTTLAKKVFNDLSVTSYFHIRAWCCISQVYQKRELLLDILGDIVEPADSIHQMTAEDIAEQLRKCLKGQKYLIILDDLWDIGAWEELRESFPNDSNGSRILFTSRLCDVALQIKPDCAPHHLRLLSDDESWELFQEKVFHKQNCPETLMEVGKVIASNCKGLPLSVVVIAGLLGRSEKKLDWWKQVSQSLSFQVFADPERQCKRVLELSYNHLPDHLQSCFLSFGAFPGNEEVPASKLLRLWVAEGFLQTCKSKSLEDSAEECLLDLIARSLVTVAKRGSDGGVKACCIHDLLRVLSLEKAKEENFLELIDGYDQLLTTTGDDFDGYRLCICSKREHFTTLKPQGPCVRSLLFFASNDAKQRMVYDISFICHNFKLIRVLDLERINMGSSFPAGLELLVLLKYLAVRGEVRSIPSSVTTLWNLETLLVKGLRGEIILPDSFWKMASLRHVHVNDRVAFSSEFNELENSSMLDNVTTLSTPMLCPGELAEKMMRRFPRLRKLSCRFSGARDGFLILDFLSNLESLKVIHYGEPCYPCQFKLPLSVKKLTLSKSCLPWSEISTIGKLPNLEVLKLLFRAFKGERWDMRDGEFPKLKFLKLDTLDIVQWNASDDHFPSLQRLVLKSCKKLEQIPYCLGEIPTLQIIEVQWCSHSAASSVRQILEEQRDMGNEDLNVLIHPSESGNASSS